MLSEHRHAFQPHNDASILAWYLDSVDCDCGATRVCLFRGYCWPKMGLDIKCGNACTRSTAGSHCTKLCYYRCRTQLPRRWSRRNLHHHRDHHHRSCAFKIPWNLVRVFERFLGYRNLQWANLVRCVDEDCFLGMSMQICNMRAVLSLQ